MQQKEFRYFLHQGLLKKVNIIQFVENCVKFDLPKQLHFEILEVKCDQPNKICY